MMRQIGQNFLNERNNLIPGWFLSASVIIACVKATPRVYCLVTIGEDEPKVVITQFHCDSLQFTMRNHVGDSFAYVLSAAGCSTRLSRLKSQATLGAPVITTPNISISSGRKTPTSPSDSDSHCCASIGATIRKYFGVFRDAMDSNFLSRAVELRSFSRHLSITGLYSAGPSIVLRACVIPSGTSGYFIGAYCTLLFFVYDAKIEDQRGNAESDDTHIGRVEEFRCDGF